jgi:hypothetical protein|tara:strand:- start:4688 stop:5164 length:477 start_codon:yes stop_codon:yes gene_type:complete
MTDTLCESWEDLAEKHVLRIWDRTSDVHFHDPVGEIRRTIDNMIDQFFDGNKEINSEVYWLNLGALALICNGEFDPYEVSEVLANKQRDYGPNNIARFGEKGLIIRLHDKVARLENLLESQVSARNESIVDTYLDIIGYSVIGLMWMNDEFLTPLRSK